MGSRLRSSFWRSFLVSGGLNGSGVVGALWVDPVWLENFSLWLALLESTPGVSLFVGVEAISVVIDISCFFLKQ